MKALLIGSSGMLGCQLHQVFASFCQLTSCNSQDLDIRDYGQVLQVVGHYSPDLILNAAGYTDVDGAEKAPDKAFAVNAMGVKHLSDAAARQDALLVHYSTDYIFGGKQDRPYRESDSPSPINEYGRSKLAGESFIRALCPRHLIIRTSWLYGPGKPNFVTRLLEKAEQETKLKVVSDQTGSPTYSVDLAEMTRTLVTLDRTGIYHVTNSGSCTRFAFANEVMRLAGTGIVVEETSSDNYPTAAARPSYSVLDNMRLKLENIELLRSWQQALSDFVENAQLNQQHCNKTM